MPSEKKVGSIRSYVWKFCCISLLIASGGLSLYAQVSVGRISGTVKDGSGAIVPDATITVTNTATNNERTAVTDENGFYTVTNLPVGTYSLSAERKGFKKVVQADNSLTADARLTIDMTLQPGELSETVQVSPTAGETVNTTSGEVARTIDAQQVQNLALNGRNYMQLLTVVPGVAVTTDDQMELQTSLATNTQSINGNRGQMNNLTVDGGTNQQSGSNASQINNVGIDFIQEVKIQTSNFSAEYGRNAGAQVNVVTRSGGNEFHGSAFEFLRNDKLDARNFFAPVRPTLRYNNFGFSFGGPIIKDKLFFFGGMEWKKIRRLAAPAVRTVPTLAELNGDFSARLHNSVTLKNGTKVDGFLKDPTKAGRCGVDPNDPNAVDRTACFAGNIIPTARITTDGKALANVYRAMIGQAASFNNSPVGNNIVFQQPNPFDFREDLLRFDYHLSDKDSIYGRYIHDGNQLIDPFGTFITSQLPTIPSLRMRPGLSVQVGWTRLIKPTLINEVKTNISTVSQHIPPASDFWKRETYGFQYTQLFPNGGNYENSIPDTTINGYSGFAGAARSLVSPTTDIMFGDNLTWVHGSHTLKTGALVYRNRIDQNGRTTYAGNVTFNTGGNTLTTNQAVGDALLGNFRTYSESSLDPIGFFRFTQVEAFVNDSWKVNSRLSLELGVRYQYGTPIYTQADNLANFDPALYNPAQAVTIKADGTIDTTKGGNRYNGLVRAGNGVPAEELPRVTGGDSAAVQAVPVGAPRGMYDAHSYFMPRIGFAYNPFKDNKTSIRGGFGMYYDRVEGNLVFTSLGNPPFAGSAQFNNANLSNITGGSSTVGVFDTLNVIDPHLDTPYTMSYSMSVQRELPFGFFAEAAYVGNLGRHLIRQPDINQPSFDLLLSNSKLPTPLNINQIRQYKGYASIRMRLSDSTSNYHALQVYATKRKGNFLTTLSYTWSKVLTDASGFNDNPEDAFNRHFSYGPASFDRRHIFAATYTYMVPFFRHSNGFVKAVMDGYEVSGITRLQSGGYFSVTATGNSVLGNRRADYIGGDVLIPDGDRNAKAWINRAAFVAAPDTRRGSSGVGIVEGPGTQTWDFSLRRRFALTERFKLLIQADIFNAFNRTNFNGLTTDLGNAGFGQLTSSGPARNIQVGMKLNF